MKFIFKWLLRLFILAVVLVVVFFLSLNSILRVVIEHNIRAQTGMDAEIGRFKLGLLEPTVEIQNLKINSPYNFGGAPFLDIPEIHIEYDRAAFAKSELHFMLVRFNLGEFDIVKNEAGQTNIFFLGLALPKNRVGNATKMKDQFKWQTGFDFTGIDALNISIGKVKFIDLKNPQNNREQTIGLDNCVIPNVKSSSDLAGLGALVVLRSDGFFDSLVDQKKSGLDVLKQLGL
jgi:uncharacterized protein involved in outer membrane biogenesis